MGNCAFSGGPKTWLYARESSRRRKSSQPREDFAVSETSTQVAQCTVLLTFADRASNTDGSHLFATNALTHKQIKSQNYQMKNYRKIACILALSIYFSGRGETAS